MWSVLMANLSVHQETRVASFRLVAMAVVHFQMLFAAVMECIAVLMDTLVVLAFVQSESRHKHSIGMNFIVMSSYLHD